MYYLAINNMLDFRKQPNTNPKRLEWEKEYRKSPKRVLYMEKYKELNRERDNLKKRERYHRLVKNRKINGINVDHKLGKEGENLALKLLNGSVFIGRPSDLSWNGKLVEVKTSTKTNYYKRNYITLETEKTNYFRWKFLLHQKGKVDYFLLILKEKDNSVTRILLIPDKDMTCKNFQISESKLQKYNKYILAK